MVAYIVVAFLAGGFFGMLGMSLLSCGPKVKLLRENNMLRQRIKTEEVKTRRKKYQPVKDPRLQVYNLVN